MTDEQLRQIAICPKVEDVIPLVHEVERLRGLIVEVHKYLPELINWTDDHKPWSPMIDQLVKDSWKLLERLK